MADRSLSGLAEMRGVVARRAWIQTEHRSCPKRFGASMRTPPPSDLFNQHPQTNTRVCSRIQGAGVVMCGPVYGI